MRMIEAAVPLFAASGRGKPPPTAQDGPSPFTPTVLATPVLIVEDELLIAWTIYEMLEDLGFTDLRLARDSAQALAMADELQPGLIVCDVNLGDGPDGIATAAALRAKGELPVLFVTGYAGEELRARLAGEVPGALLLRKPIEPAPLARHLAKLLRGPALN